jgi:molecular chaperone GrpE
LSDEPKTQPHATDISQEVIDQALESVERHARGSDPEPTLPAVSSEEVQRLRDTLAKQEAALKSREAELEASQAMARETLEKLKDQHERLLRSAADLENYKKRAGREKDEVFRFGQERLLKELLPILDNLDRALAHASAPSDFDALKVGLQMNRKLFEDTIEKFGVKGFTALSMPFDPHVHEAMLSVESDSPPNTVVHELMRGYFLHDRLLRPAMVAVAKPRQEKAPEKPLDAVAPESVPAPADGAAASRPTGIEEAVSHKG